MAFIKHTEGSGFSAGFFLKDPENCVRESMMVAANHGQKINVNGRVVVPAGAVIPANGATAKGILYEDIDVTDGDAWGSVVTEGIVYEDLLPASVESAAESAMTGITVIAHAPAVTRPDYFERTLGKLTVQSAEGTAAGDTAITVSGYSKESTDTYKYKVGDTAPAIAAGSEPDATWTTWDGSDDITAATGKGITIAVVSAGGYVVASGSATVTAKA